MAVVGIDLGTTFSAVAYVDAMGKPQVLPNSEGGNFTPSVVLFESAQNIIVGENAKNSAELYPDQVAQFIKNYMGSPDENTGKEKTWTMFGEHYRAEQISAMILKKIVKDAETTLGNTIHDVVITVPAIFGESQRNATRVAAEIAGLNVIKLLDEPVAAALHYGLSMDVASKNQLQRMMVCDLGGGTFDVTVMEVSGNSVTVLHTGGDRRLGGKLWDDKLIEHVVAAFIQQHEVDPHESRETIQILREKAEAAKKQLTQKDKSTILCHHEGKQVRIEITKDQFEEMTRDLTTRVERSIEFVMEELQEKGKLKGWQDIDQVLLVGGASRMPQIKSMIQQLSRKQPQLFEPDLAVAKGAALFAVVDLIQTAKASGDNSQLARNQIDPDDFQHLSSTKVASVTSFALGVKLLKAGVNSIPTPEDFYNELCIERNEPLPANKTVPAQTVHEGQRFIEINILEGDDEDWQMCQMIGTGTIESPQPLPLGTEVHISLSLTNESLIHVTATEQKHKSSCNFTLNRESGMKEDDRRNAQLAMARKNIS